MRLFHNRKNRGVTLVECMVFIAIWGSVCASTLWLVKETSLSRARLRQAAELAVIAQSELERARAMPGTTLAEGSSDRHEPDWPAGTSATLTLARHSDRTWLVNVEVSRTTARGVKPVRLSTYRSATP